MKLTKETVTLIIFIIATTLLSTAQSVVTTGLAGIMSDFHVSSTTAQWVYSSFLLVLGVMIPTSAFISRRFKIKTIIVSCLGLFFIGSLLAYVAPNIGVLIFARVIQAIGSGILLPITQIVILKIIPVEKWQVFMGLFGFIIGIAPALAPTVGGVIIDSVGWRAIFLLFAIATFVLILISIVGVKFEFETSDYSLDFASLILCVIACVGIMLGFSNIAGNGFDLVYVILPIVIGFIALVIFSKRQFSIKYPLLDLRILKHKYFFFGTLFSAILYFTMCGLNVIMPLFVQNVAYHSATESGLVLLPATIIMIVFNFVGPILASRIGVRKVLIASCIFSIVGYLVMMTYDVNSSINYMILTQVLRAIGAGLGLMPAVTWTISVVSGNVEDATAINNTVRQIIGAIGSAIAVVLMAVFAGGNVDHNAISVTAFGETSLVMAILAVVMLVIVILFVHDNVEVEEI
ncbi:MAG: MFS transporter [Methanobrevibacter sp.]|uniref:Multidrug efflux MFS transporter n=1 Tax=Methanobrevibacter millerae TaxID=230361 RepID=A0A8T3VSB8_9EURY|nr:MFS transporter [Methanobrevibacter sp.]MBE6511308.1 multidrug efflux MFS transporter [Methanobrevibacter millerae]MBO5150785.1 MFS transporter [Methanobrevibacter sp.]